MATIEELTETIVKFRDERDWAQFHNAKDLSLALSIEAAELNQLFLWKSPEEANVEKIKEELADVLNYALLIVWGIERSGFFNGREKWAKGFENQRV
ncbi:MAG: nucleotide pyrophosphohydrolase [Bacteroides thetaiotaomicron]